MFWIVNVSWSITVYLMCWQPNISWSYFFLILHHFFCSFIVSDSSSVLLKDLTVNIAYNFYALEIAILSFFLQYEIKFNTFTVPWIFNRIKSLDGYCHFYRLLGSGTNYCSVTDFVMDDVTALSHLILIIGIYL
jgi:hypothetical protein